MEKKVIKEKIKELLKVIKENKARSFSLSAIFTAWTLIMVLSGYKAGASKSKGLLSMKEIDEVIDKINKEVKIDDDEGELPKRLYELKTKLDKEKVEKEISELEAYKSSGSSGEEKDPLKERLINWNKKWGGSLEETIDKKIGILREAVELYEFKKQIDNVTSRDETTSLRSSETFKSNEETLKKKLF